jgi:hypothetical protein
MKESSQEEGGTEENMEEDDERVKTRGMLAERLLVGVKVWRTEYRINLQIDRLTLRGAATSKLSLVL